MTFSKKYKSIVIPLFSYLLLLTSCSLNWTQTKTIQEIDSITKIKNVFDTLDNNALVIFDVDETLIISKDSIFQKRYIDHPLFDKLQKKVRKELYPIENIRRKIHAQMHITNKQMPCEKSTASYIKELQKKNIKVIALTRATTGPYGQIKSLQHNRFEQLQKIDVDFSNAFQEIIFDQLKEHQNNYPMFYRGILLTHRNTKGEVLGAFLDHMQLKPSKIIFIDDHMQHHESVQAELKKRNIPFQGYHYTATQNLPSTFDEEVIKFQHKHLHEHHEWISEEQARAIMKKNQINKSRLWLKMVKTFLHTSNSSKSI